MAAARITVIIPTCNGPAYLCEAVGSVLAQTLPADEILVIDDGEGAAEALRAAFGAVPTLTVLRTPRPPLDKAGRGAGPARNVGLARARGDLIAFLDDDDLWKPEKLARQVTLFAGRPKLGLVACGYEVMDENGRPRRGGAPVHDGFLKPRLNGPALRAMLHRNQVTTSTVVARRECFAGGGFDDRYPVAQDWDMWLRIAPRWEFCRRPERLVRYRVHPVRNSARVHDMRACEVRLLEAARARLDGLDPWTALLLRRRLGWARGRLGRSWLRRGEPTEARREILRSLREFPFDPRIWAILFASSVTAPRPAA